MGQRDDSRRDSRPSRTRLAAVAPESDRVVAAACDRCHWAMLLVVIGVALAAALAALRIATLLSPPMRNHVGLSMSPLSP